MISLLMRIFRYLKKSYLYKKTTGIAPYPFDGSLKHYIKNAYSPIFTMMFLRQYGEDNNISLEEAEIVFYLLSERRPVEIKYIKETLYHIDEKDLNNYLSNLKNRGFIRIIHSVLYTVSDDVKLDIKDYYKDHSF